MRKKVRDKFGKTNLCNRTLPAATIARDQVHEGGERPAQGCWLGSLQGRQATGTERLWGL